jgi:hypothetical protein
MPFDADIKNADAITLDRMRTQLMRDAAAAQADFQNRMAGPNANDWISIYQVNLAARKTSLSSATTDALLIDIARDAALMTDTAFAGLTRTVGGVV